jgi:exopolyphosphatase/pppGpp-phosphohydrolase
VIKKYEIRYIVGTSGTIRAIAKIGLILSNNTKNVLYSNRIPVSFIKKAIAAIVKCKNESDISLIQGMDKSRSDIILSGALILDYAINHSKSEYMLISPYALREGIIYESYRNSMKLFS